MSYQQVCSGNHFKKIMIAVAHGRKNDLFGQELRPGLRVHDLVDQLLVLLFGLWDVGSDGGESKTGSFNLLPVLFRGRDDWDMAAVL